MHGKDFGLQMAPGFHSTLNPQMKGGAILPSNNFYAGSTNHQAIVDSQNHMLLDLNQFFTP